MAQTTHELDALGSLRDSFALHLSAPRSEKTARTYPAAPDALIRHLKAHAMQTGAGASCLAAPLIDCESAGMKRTVGQLINEDDDAWPTVLEWVAQAARPVEVLPTEPAAGEATLFALRATTRSPMDAIALRCGGILVDHGSQRILGA